MSLLDHSLGNRNRLLEELAQRQRKENSAIGWVDANRFDFIVFGKKPSLRSHPLPGPSMWAAAVSANGQIVGVIVSEAERIFGAVQDGKILWENPHLVIQQPPEISPSGRLLLVEGRYSTNPAASLLLVEDGGQKITQISQVGENPSWAPDERRFVYEEKGEILIYDLQTKHAQKIAFGAVPSWSPDGKWIVYRSPQDQFLLTDKEGKVQHSLFDGKVVLTAVRWSPDSEYLMYVEGTEAGECKQLVVFRIRDGQSGGVYPICDGYPFWMFRWLRVPFKLSLE